MRFATIDVPNAVPGPDKGTEVFGVSSKTGVIAGLYVVSGNKEVGFADFLGNFTNLAAPPGAIDFVTFGINDSAQYVGVYIDNNANGHGYANFSGNFVAIDDPKGFLTVPFGINDSGKVVGYYLDINSNEHAFTYANGVFSDLNVPGAVESAATGINAAGDIVGFYKDANGKSHGFLDKNGVFTTLDDPLGTGTIALGINDSDQIVGEYADGNGKDHGFLFSGGVYTTFDEPNATGDTVASGITNSGVIVGSYTDATGNQHGFVASRSTAQDMYGVGTASLLWRSGTGLATWDMNGGAIFASNNVTFMGQKLDPDASWSVAAVADFNADGEADVLWRQNNGSLAMWQMAGSTVTQSNTVTFNGNPITPDSSWSVAGAGDFNANGTGDILWRQNSTGSLALWSMNGSVVTSSDTVTSNGAAVAPDSSWNVAGIGDFNADGFADILWRQNATGSLVLWQMNGSAVTGSANVTNNGNPVAPDSSWSIAGVGDFNGDGKADMLWRQSATGSLAIWQMNGSAILGSGAITMNGNTITPDASWSIIEVGDFNGDSKSDVMWQQTGTGALAEWIMNGSQILSSVTPSAQNVPVTPDASWQVQSKPTDFA